jgi:anaerobic selenocysteine-containing dehydrogenase
MPFGCEYFTESWTVTGTQAANVKCLQQLVEPPEHCMPVLWWLFDVTKARVCDQWVQYQPFNLRLATCLLQPRHERFGLPVRYTPFLTTSMQWQ